MEMEEIKKVVKCCLSDEADCEDCPYDCYSFAKCQKKFYNGVIELLKKQEPASPTWEQGKAYCGKCGQRLPRKKADREINYCSYCGQAVEWDG